MIKRISYKNCLQSHGSIPHFEKEKYIFPKTSAEIILTLDSSALKKHVDLITKQAKLLFARLGIKDLIFLQEVKCPWLFQKNDFYQVKKTEAYFLSLNITPRFDGGLKVPLAELSPFLSHLFWIIRCNADMPSINFVDEQQQLTGWMCKYGNLHLYPFTSGVKDIIYNWIDLSKLYSIQWNECHNKYYKTSAIKGRRINM
jgi:hypothetical protein